LAQKTFDDPPPPYSKRQIQKQDQVGHRQTFIGPMDVDAFDDPFRKPDSFMEFAIPLFFGLLLSPSSLRSHTN
jgi:hypothetical protein